MRPLVLILTSDPRVRETLAILLEQDCHLEVGADLNDALLELRPEAVVVFESYAPSLRTRTQQAWPGIPILDLGSEGAGSLSGSDPFQLRRDILEVLAKPTDSTLRSISGLLASSIRGDIDLSLLDLFRSRPRESPATADFLPAVGRDLARTFPGIEFSSPEHPLPPGPVSLSGLVGSLLKAHLEAQAIDDEVDVRLRSSALALTFRVRDATAHPLSFPLILAGLALEPYAWSVLLREAPQQRVIWVCPSGTTTTLLRNTARELRD